MARSAAIPLAIAGFGSLILVSGIEGQSLSEIVKGEIGKGKNPLDPSGKSSGSPSGGESATSPSSILNNSINNSQVAGSAPEPFALPGFAPPGASSQFREATALKSKVKRAYEFKQHLQSEIQRGIITDRTGSERFHHRFPNYAREAEKYNKLVKEIGEYAGKAKELGL
jgi:hypothetical protein